MKKYIVPLFTLCFFSACSLQQAKQPAEAGGESDSVALFAAQSSGDENEDVPGLTSEKKYQSSDYAMLELVGSVASCGWNTFQCDEEGEFAEPISFEQLQFSSEGQLVVGFELYSGYEGAVEVGDDHFRRNTNGQIESMKWFIPEYQKNAFYEFTYNDDGSVDTRMDYIEDSPPGQYTYTYDNHGNRLSQSFVVVGSLAVTNYIVEVKDIDARGNWTRRVLYLDNEPRIVEQREIVYY